MQIGLQVQLELKLQELAFQGSQELQHENVFKRIQDPGERFRILVNQQLGVMQQVPLLVQLLVV